MPRSLHSGKKCPPELKVLGRNACGWLRAKSEQISRQKKKKGGESMVAATRCSSKRKGHKPSARGRAKSSEAVTGSRALSITTQPDEKKVHADGAGPGN